MKKFSWFLPEFPSNETTQRHLPEPSPVLNYILNARGAHEHVIKPWTEYTADDLPVIWISINNFWCLEIVQEILDFFSSPETRQVVLNPQSQIVIEYSKESVMPFLHLHLLARTLRVPLKKILFITGAFNVEELYRDWGTAEHNEREVYQRDRIRLATTSFWHRDLQKKWDWLACDNPDLDCRYYSLNARLHSHRVFTFMQIYEQGILSRGLVGMPWDIEIKRWINDVPLRYNFSEIWQKNLGKYPDYRFLTRHLEAIREILPLKVDDYDIATDSGCINTLSERFQRIPVALVTESLCETSRAVFPTEKTWKTMLYGQIFIPVTTRGFLRHLAQAGFRTFENHFAARFNQSYDMIENPWERCTRAVGMVKALCDLPANEFQDFIDICTPDIQHNYNLLHNNHLDFYYTSSKKIIEDFDGTT
jgi:hypothetical protein